MSTRLDVGDRFPSLRLELTDGRTLQVPDELGSQYTVLLFFRGHW